MKHDTDVHDTDSESAAEGGKPEGRPVNSSRRRFTRAGLSASAVMTLASRPALATFCSHSGTMSGNTSEPGQVTCAGMSTGFWRTNESEWMNAPSYDPGMCNASNYAGTSCTDYDFITKGELDDAQNADPNFPPDRYTNYLSWAGWNPMTDPGDLPNPSIAPSVANIVLSGTGLAAAPDPNNGLPRTMMQVLWDGETTLLAEVIAGFLNIDRFGAAAYGYTVNQFKTFIMDWTDGPAALTAALHFLNNR